MMGDQDQDSCLWRVVMALGPLFRWRATVETHAHGMHASMEGDGGVTRSWHLLYEYEESTHVIIWVALHSFQPLHSARESLLAKPLTQKVE
mmetsp:Transcript_33973/g.67655  ORF Transcript_33973/g.67655 Transcript_33973/m.67655 type:complete len:91 (-) Transcript_33973:458-730(-)